jgi:protein involved in polysaccharide export with SLBB domain
MSSVINALYAAGGPTAQGSFRTIKLIRSGKEIENFDIYNYLKRGVFDKNIVLRDQDVLIVPAYENQISVFGAVRRPGFYELKQGESFEDLIFYTSGFTAEANTSHIAISRYNGKEREFIDINYNMESGTNMLNGDQVEVSKIVDRFTNRVQISGAVYSPGDFEYSNGLTVRGLIEKSNGLRDYASQDRALIYRNVNDLEKEVLGFNVGMNLSGKETMNLMSNDSVVIFDKTKLREEYTVSIDGAINKDTIYKFQENMYVDDLILQAGGFKQGADLQRISIARLNNEPDSEIMSINLTEEFGDNKVTLEPFDRVSVSYLKGYEELKNITIQGKVAYPGTYSLETREERISDLIDKAGGLLDEANINGITIVRDLGELIKQTQQKELENVIEKDTLLEKEVIESTFRIGVDYEKILANGKNSKYDILLEEGDLVIVPNIVSTIQVQGAVMSSSLIRFENRLSLKDYVNRSGGFSDLAKKSKTYVIYANGDVKATKTFFGFKSYPKVTLGSIIVVPEKPEKSKMSTAELIGITSAITSLGVLVLTAIKN